MAGRIRAGLCTLRTGYRFLRFFSRRKKTTVKETEDINNDITTKRFVELNAPRTTKAKSVKDIETCDFTCLNNSELVQFLNAHTAKLKDEIGLKYGEALISLMYFNWDTSLIIRLYKENPVLLRVQVRLQENFARKDKWAANCQICLEALISKPIANLVCNHLFCRECWISYVETQIQEGQSTEIACMSPGCNVLTTIGFVLNLLNQSNSALKQRYLQLAQDMHVNSHPLLRYCPGANCQSVIKVTKPLAKRVTCSECHTECCFSCGGDYHAPVDCETMKKWLAKLADDSETKRYIIVKTKNCPKCKAPIEKDNGCDHMTCSRCHFGFCWLCLGRHDYGHGHNKCRDPVTKPVVVAAAKKALDEYRFYYDKWLALGDSCGLEQQISEIISESRIDESIGANGAPRKDWRYMDEAVDVVDKCRLTLRYLYVHAYYLKSGQAKDRFLLRVQNLEKDVESQINRIIETTDTRGIRQAMKPLLSSRAALFEDVFRE